MMDFQAARFLVEGGVPVQEGNNHPYVTPTGAFETSDGYINIALGQKQWPAFCKALDRPDLTEHADYVSQEQRFRNRPALNLELEAAFKTKTTQAWLDLLEPLGIPAGPIYKVNEVFDDAQVQHLEMAVPVHHPVKGDFRVVATPVGLSRTPAKVVTPTPEVGEHNAEILAEIGITGAAELDRLKQSKVI